jgi:hypothetical protein
MHQATSSASVSPMVSPGVGGAKRQLNIVNATNKWHKGRDDETNDTFGRGARN